MKKTSVSMLYEWIVKENINQSDLCQGLCSTSAFSRYVRGEAKMDRLMFQTLMQRSGKGSEQFVTVLSYEEYVFFLVKQMIYHARIEGKWEEVEELLSKQGNVITACNEQIGQQYCLLISAMVQEKKYGNKEESMKLLEKAIALTLPDFFSEKRIFLYLSIQEIYLILYWTLLQKEKKIKIDTLSFLMEYVTGHFKDKLVVEKLYPQIAAFYIELQEAEKEYKECLIVSEKALEMMISSGYVLELEKILRINVNTLKHLQMTEQFQKREKQLQAWMELKKEYGFTQNRETDDICMPEVWQEIELLEERISIRRTELKLTQEKLSEDICTPETLSRIETGKRIPSRKNYMALMKKLKLREEYYYCQIETDNFEVLEIKRELEKAIMNHKWEKAEDLGLQLEKKLDTSSDINKQYLAVRSYIIDESLGKIPMEERMSRLIECLQYTIKDGGLSENVMEWEDAFWKRYFTNIEIQILIYMADVLRDSNQIKNAIVFIEKILGIYKRSKISLEFSYRNVLLIYARLCAWYIKTEKYPTTLKYSEEGIKMLFYAGNSKMLGLFEHNGACALEHLDQKETALKKYELAFYSAELLGESYSEISKKYFENLAGTQRNWY